MKSFAYVIIDTSLGPDGSPRDKLYVGKSNDPHQRFESHIRAALSGQDTVFYRAIRSHGHENFVIRDTYECDSEEEAFEKEKQLITELRTYVGFENSRGYNSTLGGEGFDSLTSSTNMTELWKRDREMRVLANQKRWQTLEEKQKQSDRLKTVLSDPLLREERTNNMLARWKDPVYHEHMSRSHAERWNDPAFRSMVVSRIKEAKSTLKEKERLAKRNSEKWKSMTEKERKAVIEKMQLARRAKNLLKKQHNATPKQSKKMGPSPERAKKTWQDPKVKANRIQKLKDAWADPEKKRLRLEACKRTRENNKEKESSDLLATREEKSSSGA